MTLVKKEKYISMPSAIQVSKEIRKNILADWSELLEDNNLNKIFLSVTRLPLSTEDKNKIICFIIYSFDPESLWLDLKKDRTENKKSILGNLDADTENELYKNIVSNKHESVNEAIFNYLESLKTWKWKAVFDLLEHSSNISRFAMKETKEEIKYSEINKEGQIEKYSDDVDIATITKVNKEKGLLLNQSIEYREKADKIIEEIRKEFVSTDNATQQDFGFQFSDTSKKRDIMSWREFIKSRNERKAATS